MASSQQLEIRANIKFCQRLGETPTATLKMINTSRGNNPVTRSIVFDWHKRFRDGQETLEDQKGRGRKSSLKPTLVTSLRDALADDRRLTIRDLAERFDVSIGTVHHVLSKDLHMRKVHARWVPRLLTTDEKSRRVAESRAFLRRVEREGDDFLSRVITMDESWLWLYDPETREQSSVWKTAGSPPPKKARVSKSGGKFMFVMFADKQGMLLQHAVPKGKTVNAEYFCKVLRRDLVRAIQKKRPDVPLEHFLLHMDNASSHTAEATRLELAVLGLGVLSHPPYSPDLAPFDFQIFPEIKKQLKGRQFESLDDLRFETQRISKSFNADSYKDMYTRWIHRHRRCIQCKGEYFEKE